MEKINQDKFYKMTIEEMKKVAEEVMKEKYNLKNDLLMTGWAFKINELINNIQNSELKEKLDRECQEIWDKWFSKIKKEQLTEKNLAIFNALIGKTLKN